MMTPASNVSKDLRIIWAITAKDILDALKNKTVLGVLIPALLMVVLYNLLPGLEHGSEPPYLLVYDAGNSSLSAALEKSAMVAYRAYDTREQMEWRLRNGDSPELGLIIPAGFDQRVAAGEPLELEGFMLHWISPADAGELEGYIETHLAELAGAPVEVRVEVTYPRADSRGMAFLASSAMVFVVAMVGVSMVPHIMIEEKQFKTIDALLVSPANAGKVTLAKALTGLFYSLLCAGVAFAINRSLITHWGLAIVAAICGSLFTVALGLLLGSLLESRQQLMIWAWVLFIPLLFPVFLSIMTDLLPENVIRVVNWVPTVALTKVLRVSFSDNAALPEFGPPLVLVSGCALALLTVVAWVVRRADR